MNSNLRRTILGMAVVSIACGILVFAAGVCNAQAISPSTESVNLAAQENLAVTQSILVFKQDMRACGMYVYLTTIDDPAVITPLIAALDTTLPVVQGSACTNHYRLLFHLADGSTRQIDYACDRATPAFLAIAQRHGDGRSVVAPDAFNALMADAIEAAPALDCSRL